MRGKGKVEDFAFKKKWCEQPMVFTKVNKLGPTTRPAPGISKR